jgi:hypothetical protein
LTGINYNSGINYGFGVSEQPGNPVSGAFPISLTDDERLRAFRLVFRHAEEKVGADMLPGYQDLSLKEQARFILDRARSFGLDDRYYLIVWWVHEWESQSTLSWITGHSLP